MPGQPRRSDLVSRIAQRLPANDRGHFKGQAQTTVPEPPEMVLKHAFNFQSSLITKEILSALRER